VPASDIFDSTWICATPAVVAAVVAEPSNWADWWPELELIVDERRGEKGVRWTVAPTPSGEAGSMEVYLEPAFDGVVVHYFLRLDPVAGRRMSRRRRRRVADFHRRRVKRAFWALGDQLDPGRTARVAAPR
jgi:hypothetical protein